MWNIGHPYASTYFRQLRTLAIAVVIAGAGIHVGATEPAATRPSPGASAPGDAAEQVLPGAGHRAATPDEKVKGLQAQVAQLELQLSVVSERLARVEAQLAQIRAASAAGASADAPQGMKQGSGMDGHGPGLPQSQITMEQNILAQQQRAESARKAAQTQMIQREIDGIIRDLNDAQDRLQSEERTKGSMVTQYRQRVDRLQQKLTEANLKMTRVQQE